MVHSTPILRPPLVTTFPLCRIRSPGPTSVLADSPMPVNSSMMLSAMSGGDAQIVQIVQRYPEFETALHALGEQWRQDSFIHGDIKWEN